MTDLLAPLLDLGYATLLPDTAPWRVAVVGPTDDPVRLRSLLQPWLRSIPHERDMPLQLAVAAGFLTERDFPWGAAFLWPAAHPWQPLLNPWLDPGQGTLWLELLGDVDSLRAQAGDIAATLYRALVLDPPTVAPLLQHTVARLAGQAGLEAPQSRSLMQDARPLQRDREMVQLWIQDDPEIHPGAGEHVGRQRMLLSLHAGSGPLHHALLPRFSDRWAEAVLDPRDLTPEMLGQLPRTVPAAAAGPVLRACGDLGAVRRAFLRDRIAEVVHDSEWELQIGAEICGHQAWHGVHRLGDLALHRWGWQRPMEGQQLFITGALGQPAVALTWNAEAIPPCGPLFGLPVHQPRLLDSRDALRACTDWSAVAQLQRDAVVLRAGSKGLLRTLHSGSFASTDPWSDWLLTQGLVSECHRLRPVAAILG